jgi:hypothetical protein
MMAFATPVVSYPWPGSEALNRDLAALILDAERRGGGISRSNVGGWHSTTDFFEWPEPAVRTLRERVKEMTMAITRAIVVLSNSTTPSPKFCCTLRTSIRRFRLIASISREGGNATEARCRCQNDIC